MDANRLLFSFNMKQPQRAANNADLEDPDPDLDLDLKVQLRSIVIYDTADKQLKVPDSIGYYREPQRAAYPLDLTKGFEIFIPRSPDYEERPYEKAIHYMMRQSRSELEQLDLNFCSNRWTLRRIMFIGQQRSALHLVATKFKGCIYLAEVNLRSNDGRAVLRNTFAYKLRQYLFADKPGGVPNTDEPVDEDRQFYGTFSAQLGQFKLLYSGEISGVYNTESLGDLNSPSVLSQLKLANVKVLVKHGPNWRKNYRFNYWHSQALLSGIEQLKVALADDQGQVREPIQSIRTADLINNDGIGDLQLLHRFLCEISAAMAHVDCPYTAYRFHVLGNKVSLERHLGPNEYSYIDEKFIKFMNAS